MNDSFYSVPWSLYSSGTEQVVSSIDFLVICYWLTYSQSRQIRFRPRFPSDSCPQLDSQPRKLFPESSFFCQHTTNQHFAVMLVLPPWQFPSGPSPSTLRIVSGGHWNTGISVQILLKRIFLAISMISSDPSVSMHCDDLRILQHIPNGMLFECLMFFSFLRSRGGSLSALMTSEDAEGTTLTWAWRFWIVNFTVTRSPFQSPVTLATMKQLWEKRSQSVATDSVPYCLRQLSSVIDRADQSSAQGWKRNQLHHR